MMNDYRLTVTIKNNRILKLIEGAGYKSVNTFCKVHELRYARVCKLINMTDGALRDGDFSQTAKGIADALGVHPEDLFNERQLEGHDVTKVVKEIDNPLMLEGRIKQITAHSPEDAMIRLQAERSLDGGLDDLIATLAPRHQLVIRAYFGIGRAKEKNLTEVGKLLNISMGRASQILLRSLRLLRKRVHPNAIGVLADLAD